MAKYYKYKTIKTNILNLNNLDNMLNIAKDISNKIDLINLSWLNTRKETRVHIITRSTAPALLYNIVFCLLTQSKNGNAAITHRHIDNEVLCQLLFILGKYYKTIVINLLYCNPRQSPTYNINVSGFKGITTKEKKELISICKQVDSKIKAAGQHVTIFNKNLRKNLELENKHSVNSIDIFILKVLDNDITDFKKRVKEINRIQQKYMVEEYKLILYIDTILKQIKKNKELTTNIKALIFTKQIEYVLNWVNVLSKNMNIKYDSNSKYHIASNKLGDIYKESILIILANIPKTNI